MKTAESINIWHFPTTDIYPKMNSITSHIYDENVEQKETIAQIWISTLQKWVLLCFLTGHFVILHQMHLWLAAQSQTESLLLFCFGCSSPRKPWAGLSWARLGFAKCVSIYALADSQLHLLCRKGLEVTLLIGWPWWPWERFDVCNFPEPSNSSSTFFFFLFLYNHLKSLESLSFSGIILGQLKYPPRRSASASRVCGDGGKCALSNTHLHEKITRRGLRPVKREAAPVVLVTAVDCCSRRAGFGRPLGGLRRSESLSLHWLLPSHVCCHGAEAVQRLPDLHMIATSVEQQWPRGRVKFHNEGSDRISISDRFRGTYKCGPNRNRWDEELMCLLLFTLPWQKSPCSMNAAPVEAALPQRPWELPARLNSELKGVRLLDYLNKVSHRKLLNNKYFCHS